MKTVINLTKILLKNNFSIKENKSKIGMFLLYIFAFAYIGGIVGFASYQAISALKVVNQQALILAFLFFVNMMISLFRGIFTSINVLYFSKDTENLLPLPIKPKNILISKFNVMLIYEYIIEIFLLLIPMIIYGILNGLGILYYISTIVILLLLPILPLMISSFLIIIVMRFTNIIKNKDFVQYISIGITIVLIILMQFISSGTNDEITGGEIVSMFMKTNGTVEIFTKAIITLKLAVNTIININNINGIISLGLFVLVNILLYILVVNISSKMYLKGLVLSNSGSTEFKKKKTNNNMLEQTKTNKKIISYIKKELKLIYRNPIFFMNIILPPILFPIIISIPFAININNLGELDLMELSQMASAINSTKGVGIVLAIISGFFMFNFSSITSISREGKDAIFMKSIPISLHKQITYKIVPGILLNLIPILYVVTISVVLLKLNILLALLVFVIANLLNILENNLVILIDLKHPKINWTTEYAVIKQNFNTMYQMIFNILIIFLLIIISFNIQNIFIFSTIFIAISLISVYIVNKYINKKQFKIFKNIN